MKRSDKEILYEAFVHLATGILSILQRTAPQSRSCTAALSRYRLTRV